MTENRTSVSPAFTGHVRDVLNESNSEIASPSDDATLVLRAESYPPFFTLRHAGNLPSPSRVRKRSIWRHPFPHRMWSGPRQHWRNWGFSRYQTSVVSNNRLWSLIRYEPGFEIHHHDAANAANKAVNNLMGCYAANRVSTSRKAVKRMPICRTPSLLCGGSACWPWLMPDDAAITQEDNMVSINSWATSTRTSNTRTSKSPRMLRRLPPSGSLTSGWPCNVQ